WDQESHVTERNELRRALRRNKLQRTEAVRACAYKARTQMRTHRKASRGKSPAIAMGRKATNRCKSRGCVSMRDSSRPVRRLSHPGGSRTIRQMRIIDLSAPIAPTPPDAPPLMRIEIDYADHAAGAATAQDLFGVPSRLLRNGEGWALETITA